MKSLGLCQLQGCQGQLVSKALPPSSRLSNAGFKPSGVVSQRLFRPPAYKLVDRKAHLRRALPPQYQSDRCSQQGWKTGNCTRTLAACGELKSASADPQSDLTPPSKCWRSRVATQRRKPYKRAAQFSYHRARRCRNLSPQHTPKHSRHLTGFNFSTQIPGSRVTLPRPASNKVQASAEPQLASTEDSPEDSAKDPLLPSTKNSAADSSRGSSKSSRKAPLPTFEDFVAAAAEKGVNLELKTLGPVFWIEAKTAEGGLAGPPGKLLGRVDGFILPWLGGNLLHLDSLRMARIESEKVRSIFGFALILGGAMLRHGYDRGCKKAELLAINDTDEYHRKLVNYYGRLGFKAVHEVTGGLRDVPHMLVWGGLGTRMDADIESILRKWSKRFVRNASDGEENRT